MNSLILVLVLSSGPLTAAITEANRRARHRAPPVVTRVEDQTAIVEKPETATPKPPVTRLVRWWKRRRAER